MNLITKNIHTELGDFFQKIERSDTKVHKVSNSAFSQARAKLSHTAFIELSSIVTQEFYKNENYKRWNNFILVAVDGSTLRLPNTDGIRDYFGGQKKQEGAKSESTLARISEAYDPINNIVLDATIEPYHIGERKMLRDHLDKLNSTHLTICDRGYSGFAVYKSHQKRNIQYCIRISFSGSGKQITKFAKSDQTDAIIELKCPNSHKSKRSCSQAGVDRESITCRLLKIDIGTDTPEILITSLIDKQEFPYDTFKELYHLRWAVEEHYKLLKTRLELANFSGLTKEAIHQDFYAKIFMSNLTGYLVNQANIEIEDQDQDKNKEYKHRRKVNMSNAIEEIRTSGILLFIRESYQEILKKLNNSFKKILNIVRDNRNFPRIKSVIERRYSIVYK